MDTDVAGKLERLCVFYREAQAELIRVSPTTIASNRAMSRARTTAVNVLGQLGERRKPHSAALVRLAYVRGLRSVREGARLGPEQEREVAYLQGRVDKGLNALEGTALISFNNHLRRLKLVSWATAQEWEESAIGTLTNSDRPYALEQHARACIHSVLDMATAAGALAGTPSSSYDVDHVRDN